jgi:hypothetical protein
MKILSDVIVFKIVLLSMWYNKLRLLPTSHDTIKKKTEINFNLTKRNKEMGVLSVPSVKSCHPFLMAGWFAGCQASLA